MPDTCVKCKSDNITADGSISEGDKAYINVTCKACGAKYTEEYTYVKYEEGHLVD